MVRPKGKIKAICQNESCSHYRKEKGKDIVKRGKNKRKHQRFFCFHCNTYFVETKGTPLYRRKLSERKIKKLKPFSNEELTAGDFWGFTAIKRKSFFFTAFSVSN